MRLVVPRRCPVFLRLWRRGLENEECEAALRSVARQQRRQERRRMASEPRRDVPWPNACVLLAVLFSAIPAIAAEPLLVSANVRGPAALHPNHIARGWSGTDVIDARCDGDNDPGGCWIKMHQAAKRKLGRYISWRLGTPIDYPVDSLTVAESGLKGGELKTQNMSDGSDRIYPNIANLSVRTRFVTTLRMELERHEVDIIFHDNIIYGPSAWLAWEPTCNYLGMLRDDEWLLIANVANGFTGWMTWEDFVLFKASVDGMLREIGVHPRQREHAEQLANQVQRDKLWLDDGKWLVLMARNGLLVDEVTKANPNLDPAALALLIEQEQVLESRYNAAYCMMIADPGEHCYVNHAFWKNRTGWELMPEQLGEPISDMRMNADASMERIFEGGILRTRRQRTVELVEVP